MDIGEDTNVYSATELAFYLNKDGEEYVKFFDDDSPFAPWNRAFKREGAYFGYNKTCYFGMNYYDTLVSVEELKDISLKFRGSSNQRVIDVKKTLQTNDIVWVENLK